jgi:NTP pyrophosphatase (non-canonical NTP hydrolase)
MTSKSLIKLIEEAGELQQALAKKLAYLNTDDHPDGKGSLKLRIEEEIADVLAAIYLVVGELCLDDKHINGRSATKLQIYTDWLEED